MDLLHAFNQELLYSHAVSFKSISSSDQLNENKRIIKCVFLNNQLLFGTYIQYIPFNISFTSIPDNKWSYIIV